LVAVGGFGLVMASWAGAGPAGAHAGFVGATSLPVDEPVELVMRVPHERGPAVFNVEIQVAMPAGWTPLSCATKDTWTCELTTSGGRSVVRFTKGAGAARAEDERFSFGARTAREAGIASFPVTQRYNTGEVVRWIDGPGSAEPAATLRLTGTAAPTTAAPTTAAAPAPAPTTAAAPTTTAAPNPSATVAAAPAVVATSAEVDDERSSTGPIAAAAAVAALIVGAGAALRRRRGRAGAS
jgi:MYXO-CTERM domain-containing protein